MKRAPDSGGCLSCIPDAAWQAATVLSAALVTFFFAELLWVVFRHAPYQQLFWGCLGVSLLLGRWLPAHLSGAAGRHLKQSLTGAVAAAALVFVMTVPAPFSVLSLTVGNVTHAATLVVSQPRGGRRGIYRQVSLRPRLSSQDVVLRLPEPPGRHGGSLKITFGHQKRPYFLYRIGYGTDVLLWRVGLAVFEGRALAEAAHTDERKNHFAVTHGVGLLTSRINSRPWLQIRSDPSFVRRHASRLRMLAVRMIWFVLVSAGSLAVIWLPLDRLPGRRLWLLAADFFLRR